MSYIELKKCTNVLHTSVNKAIIPKMLLFAMPGLLVCRSNTVVQTEISQHLLMDRHETDIHVSLWTNPKDFVDLTF